MKRQPICVTPHTTVAAAAVRMVAQRIHRVFVVDHGALHGVFSTRDILDAIQIHRTRAPISDSMSTPILTVDSTATILQATERLVDSGVSGLVVLEDELPVGSFTQVEALQATAKLASPLSRT
ncbi:MAG: CBS domain-containing protein [Polyangiaceae bacterium]|nr:CBS domain-containing protein [Polyangiaceae bacterium]